MCKAEAIVNSSSLTVNQLTDPDSPEPLTPSHLLTMKAKVLLSAPGKFEPADMYARKRWRRVQHLANGPAGVKNTYSAFRNVRSGQDHVEL